MVEFNGVGGVLLGLVVGYVPCCLPLLGVLPAGEQQILPVPRQIGDHLLRLRRADF